MNLLTDAMDVVLQWGPERSIPDIERLRAKHADVSDDELRLALTQAERVLSEAEGLAGGIKDGSVREAGKLLRQDRPWLTDEQVGRAIQQGLYYHWRDTGL